MNHSSDYLLLNIYSFLLHFSVSYSQLDEIFMEFSFIFSSTLIIYYSLKIKIKISLLKVLSQIFKVHVGLRIVAIQRAI
jgi:hypothetical protein